MSRTNDMLSQICTAKMLLKLAVVNADRLLCVWLQAAICMTKHVEYIVPICNQRTYLLMQLKRQGLPPAQLQNVFHTIIFARVLYALLAWRGYMNASDINSLQHLFLKAQ